MNKLKKLFGNNEKGQGMIEYTLILLLVVGAVLMLKGRMEGWSKTAADKVEGGLDNF